MPNKRNEKTLLVIHGPNLNRLGKRDPAVYGSATMDDVNKAIEQRAADAGFRTVTFHSNSEGALIDFIQERSSRAAGIVINPGALTHYGLSLREALQDSGLPVIEVHISNIYAREEWRARSVIAPIARGQISGLGWRGYLAAIDALAQG